MSSFHSSVCFSVFWSGKRAWHSFSEIITVNAQKKMTRKVRRNTLRGQDSHQHFNFREKKMMAQRLCTVAPMKTTLSKRKYRRFCAWQADPEGRPIMGPLLRTPGHRNIKSERRRLLKPILVLSVYWPGLSLISTYSSCCTSNPYCG